MKNFLFPIALFILNVFIKNGYASIHEKEDSFLPLFHVTKSSSQESSASFKEIPDEVVVYISSYLQGQDFRNLLYTSKKITGSLMKEETFFIPSDIEVIAHEINDTPITEFSNLVARWSRNTRKSVLLLREVYLHYEKYQVSIPKEEYEVAKNRFENCVKTLNLLYIFGDHRVVKNYKKFYRLIQNIICEERASEREDYIIHLSNFSLLVPSVRKSISKNYQEGKLPFSKNPEQAILYAIDLELPLTPKAFK